jgi:hypothetical protein
MLKGMRCAYMASCLRSYNLMLNAIYCCATALYSSSLLRRQESILGACGIKPGACWLASFSGSNVSVASGLRLLMLGLSRRTLTPNIQRFYFLPGPGGTT